MFSEQIELKGHIIDSLTLPKVLDEILTRGGTFNIRDIRIGKQRHDGSYARIEVFGQTHGAEVVEGRGVDLVPAPDNGVFPEDFHVTTNQVTHVNVKGKWLEVRPETM